MRRKKDGERRARSDRSEGTASSALDAAGIILAGVHAWGGCALERAVCRPLMPIANQPIAAHILAWFRAGGVGRAAVCGNGDTSAMQRVLGNGHEAGVDVRYSRDLFPRGPAGCARDAAEQIDEAVLVLVDGTLLPQFDLRDLLKAHDQSGAAVTVVVSADSTGDALRPSLTPMGVYVFSPAALSTVPSRGYHDIKESLLPKLHESGARIERYEVSAASARRVFDAPSYLAASRWALQRLPVEGGALGEAGYRRVRGAWVHESAEIDASVQFVGPVIVGPRSYVGAGVMIVGPTTIGERCRIDGGAVVSRSILWNDCHIESDAVVDDAVLTDGALVVSGESLRHTVSVGKIERGGGPLSSITSRWRWTGGRSPGRGASRGDGDAFRSSRRPRQEAP